MSVLQLSRKTDQLAQEYAYMEYLSSYGTAPKPAHIDMDGFECPFLIEEFVEGGHIEEHQRISTSVQTRWWSCTTRR